MSKVEWKRLGDCMKVLRGCRLTKSQLSENELYPVYHGGIQPIGYYTQSNRQANTTMIINVGASAGTVGFCDTLFWSSDGCFCLSQNSMYNQKFLFHYLKYKEIQIIQKVRKAGSPTLDSQVIENIELPIVNFNVQRQIVSQLDIFTTLIAKLESELTLRQKQYEHYREELLNFEGDEEVKWKELGKFAHKETQRNKLRLDYPAYSITQGGLVPTRDFFKEKTNVTSKDTSTYFVVHKHWFVYSPSRIDVGSINYLRVEGPVIVSPIDVVFSINADECTPEYLYYFLTSHMGMKQIMNNREGVEGMGRKNLPFERFASIKVPIPSPDEQDRIVSQLDTFEQLIAALKREIALRRKQYEFYREKLLTFE